jgi:hypothetical protein
MTSDTNTAAYRSAPRGDRQAAVFRQVSR